MDGSALVTCVDLIYFIKFEKILDASLHNLDIFIQEKQRDLYCHIYYVYEYINVLSHFNNIFGILVSFVIRNPKDFLAMK